MSDAITGFVLCLCVLGLLFAWADSIDDNEQKVDMTFMEKCSKDIPEYICKEIVKP